MSWLTALKVARMGLWLVIGGASSGKSEYAETLAVETAARMQAADLVYIATMAAKDEESLGRIDNHKRRRAGRGFRTVEKAMDLASADGVEGAVVLLEDISNLAANELFVCEDGMYIKRSPDLAYKAMADGIRHLMDKCLCLFAVTNDIFEDGGLYEEPMLSYVKLLGDVNSYLAMEADRATEVVCGIPLHIKPVLNIMINDVASCGLMSCDAMSCKDMPFSVKPCDTKPCDTKPCDIKPCDIKHCDTKPCDIKHCDTKPNERIHIDKTSSDKPLSGDVPNGSLPCDSGPCSISGRTLIAKDIFGNLGQASSRGVGAREGHMKVILVTGGFCQGKTAFARYKAAEHKLPDTDHVVIVDDYQDTIRCRLRQEMPLSDIKDTHGTAAKKNSRCGEAWAYELIEKLIEEGTAVAVVVSALPCSGPVPTDPFERLWRDEVGKACQVLAGYSSEVYRVVCGMPQRLK